MKSTRSSERTLRTTKKKEYNVNKLADLAFAPPIVAEETKKLRKKGKIVKKGKKMVIGKKKKGRKVSSLMSYLELVKEGVRELGKGEKGVSSYAVVKYIESNYPSKSDRKHIRAALAKGVEMRVLLKRKLTYKFSKKEQQEQTKGRKRSARSSAKKPSTKVATKKRTTAKPKTKKTTSKKATTKKTTSKKEKTTHVAKKARKSSKKSEEAQVVASESVQETGKAVWQYYDHGWHDYRSAASDIVEGVYSEYMANPGMGLDVRSVQSGKFHYLVDFNTMTQQNTETGTKRNIQRKV